MNLVATSEITPAIRKWKEYSAYKPSGKDWLGEIPAHWEPTPLKLGVEYVEGPGIMAADFTVDGVPLIRIAGIGGRKATLNGCNYLSPELVARRWEHFRVRCGDLLISGSASTGLCSEVDEVTEGAVPYTGIIIVRPRPYTTEKAFVRWFFVSGSFLTQAEIARSGSTIQHFGPSHLSRMLMVLPPLSEQRIIATFLDRETTKIDALVVKKERLIELLQEKRAALITRAVTKGLDPNMSMKDSGVEWLGKIPAHWEVKRLKWLTETMVAGPFGSSLTKDLYTLDGYRVYGQEQVIPGDFSIGNYYIPQELYRLMTRYAVGPGDVLISCVGTFGKIAVVPEGIEAGIINPRLIKVTPKKRIISSIYLGLLLKSRVAFDQLEQISRGGTMGVINIALLSETLLPVPDLPEQLQIADYIRNETTKIDSLVAKVREGVEKLKEYRTALISAAVTGKIDVRSNSGVP